MRERNYTNPEDKGRFGFSATGKYNAPYKMEGIITSITIGAAAVAVIFVWITALKIVRGNPTGAESGRLLEAMVGGVSALIFSALIALAAGFIMKYISDGFTCSYIADEDKFTADIGGTYHTIYYKEVQNVYFFPRTSFFKRVVRGYDVTVKVSGANEEFSIVSSGYLSEQATPFYIIKERMELFRSSEERKRSVEKPQIGDHDLNIKPPSSVGREKDKAVFSLGSAAEMPSVGLSAVGSAAAGSNAAEKDPVYIDNDGRERTVNDIVAQGTFYEIMNPGKALIIGVIGAALYVAIFFIVPKVLSIIGGIGDGLSRGAILLAAPFYIGTIINFLRGGDERRYAANGREFVIYTKGKPEEHILYSDVQSVDYKPMALSFNINGNNVRVWIIKAYKVDILTRYGVLKYNYVVPKTRKNPSTKDLPFEEIRKRIGVKRDL